MTEPEPHEFDEDVNDGSMCVCGIPATVHDAWEVKHRITPALAAAVERATRAEAALSFETDRMLAFASDAAELGEQVAKVREVIPAACYLTRSTEVSCAEYLNAVFDNGAKFTEDMACLPCRVRAALGSVGATEVEAGCLDPESTEVDGECRHIDGTRHAPASPAAAEPERCHSCGWLKSNHLANGIVRMAPGVMDEHCAGYLATPAEPTRADEPRACPRPEAHHYQPGTKP